MHVARVSADLGDDQPMLTRLFPSTAEVCMPLGPPSDVHSHDLRNTEYEQYTTMSSYLNLEGKHALVSGSAGGIGRELVRELLSRDEQLLSDDVHYTHTISRCWLSCHSLGLEAACTRRVRQRCFCKDSASGAGRYFV